MSRPVKIIGSYLSPYVRKVLVVLHLKGVAYGDVFIWRLFNQVAINPHEALDSPPAAWYATP